MPEDCAGVAVFEQVVSWWRASAPSRSPTEKAMLRDLAMALSWLIVAIFFALIAILLVANGEQEDARLRFAGISLMMALAASAGGCVLGFIFGIPRTLARENPVDSNAAKKPGERLLGSNTNLEQVSDWLTKIVLGATLVQVQDIPKGFGVLCATIGAAFGNVRLGFVCGALVAIFVPVGFLVMYLQTRTFLTILFARSQKLMDDDQELLGASKVLETVAGQIADGGQPPRPVLDMAQRTVDATANASTPDAVRARGFARVVLGEWSRAGEDLRSVAERQDDPRARNMAAMAFARARRPDEALAVLPEPETTAAEDLGGDDVKTLLGRMFVSLYEPEPKGYEEALRIGLQLENAPVIKGDRRLRARLNLYRTAALGQKARRVKKSGDPAAFKAIADEALKAAKAAIDLDRGNEATIRAMLDGDGQDDDLTVFKRDSRFRKLVD